MTDGELPPGFESLNLNVTLLRQDFAKLELKLDAFPDRYVPIQTFEERSKAQGERTGSIEKAVSDLEGRIEKVVLAIGVAVGAPVVVAGIFAVIKLI